MKQYTITEILGDGISTELSESVHHVASTLPFTLEFRQVDLSLENRRRDREAAYDAAKTALTEVGIALKYPTVTETESPNKVLREFCDFSVIHRQIATFPGVENNFKRTIDLDVIRVATGGTYSDRGRRIGTESAVSLRVIERQPSRFAARYAFRLASAEGKSVVSTSKWTIQREADGLFEQECDDIASNYPGTPYRRELFDALLAGVIMNPDRYSVIVCPNEYGDFLSDMACGLVGSIGLGDSASFAFEKGGHVRMAMFDPAGGTAPDIAGQGICNPTAALLAFGSLLNHIGEREAGHGLRDAVRSSIADGDKTGDIGGKMKTMEFTEAVEARLASTLSPA
ncbi:MAG TPA: isocitrate dehydrogenase [Planctomycetes bacterium]|nr:isocitrate dehydrogenase [Planctomycetota bacterium]